MSGYAEELAACLDVLEEWVAEAVPSEGGTELLTAIFQTVELVDKLVSEYELAWSSVETLRALVNELQQKLADKDGKLWTPHVTLKPTAPSPYQKEWSVMTGREPGGIYDPTNKP